MNRNILTLSLLLISFFALKAQENSELDLKYRRSSLHIVLMESESFPNKDTVMEAYFAAPFPDKYNNHFVENNTFNPSKYALSAEEIAADSLEKTKLGKFVSGAVDKVSAGIIDAEAKHYPLIIEKYLNDTKLAKQLVSKWFNRNKQGVFNMNLISERGFYDASQMQAELAAKSVRGSAILGDAGEELIKNTFVVVNKMNFVSNERVAALVRDAAKFSADQKLGVVARKAAYKAADITYNKTKDGYSVWTTSYLYQLQWNDSISAVFYQDFWTDPSNIDSSKVQAFEQTDLFSLKFVGDEKARSLVLFSGKEKNTPDKIIKLATIRNLDNVYAKLQKKYDVFKTKTPIYSTNPLSAKIGMKEGLEGGEKFQVLEQQIDKKTGRTEYVSRGIITVDKRKIWDNRFNLDAAENVDSNGLEATEFKGEKNKYYKGMLIRQIK